MPEATLVLTRFQHQRGTSGGVYWTDPLRPLARNQLFSVNPQGLQLITQVDSSIRRYRALGSVSKLKFEL